MRFWIFIVIAMGMVLIDEILKRKRGYTEKKYAFFKTIGAIPKEK